MEAQPLRYDKYDTIKAFLMFCVVFAHLQNLFSGSLSESIYRTIYIFHMPAFIFITGRFARFSPRKILTRQILLYAVFQVLYITGDHLIRGDPWELQFTTPRWILWYLVACAFWLFLLPLLDTEKPARMAAALALSIALALAAGYWERLGFWLSLSRVVVFLPFFLLGLYWGKLESRHPSEKALRTAGAAAGVLAAGLSWLLLRLNVSRGLLYGALSYAECGGSPALRALQLAAASCWIAALVCLAPQGKIPLVTTVGQNTLQIFLLHGFLVRIIGRYQLLSGPSEYRNLLWTLILTLCLLALLGNPWVQVRRLTGQRGRK